MDDKGSVKGGDGASIFGETSFFPIRPVSPAELIEILTLKGLDVSASVDLAGYVNITAKTEDGEKMNVGDVQRVFSWSPISKDGVPLYEMRGADVLVIGKVEE